MFEHMEQGRAGKSAPVPPYEGFDPDEVFAAGGTSENPDAPEFEAMDFHEGGFDVPAMNVSAEDKEKKRQELRALDERHAGAIRQHIALADTSEGVGKKAMESEIDGTIVSLHAQKRAAEHAFVKEAPIAFATGANVYEGDEERDKEEGARTMLGTVAQYLGRLNRQTDRWAGRWMDTILGRKQSVEEEHVTKGPADSFKLGGVPRRDPDSVIDPSRIRGGEGLTLATPEPKVTGWGAVDGNFPAKRYTDGVTGDGAINRKSMSMETPGLSLQDVPKPETRGWGAVGDPGETDLSSTRQSRAWDSSDDPDVLRGMRSPLEINKDGSIDFAPGQEHGNAAMNVPGGVGMDVSRTDARTLDVPIAMNAEGEIVYDAPETPLMPDERRALDAREPASQAAGYADYLDQLKTFAGEDKKWHLRVRELIPKLTDADPAVSAAAKAEIKAIRLAEKERHDGVTLH